MLFNGAQIHLLFNHAPVLLYPFILLTCLWAIWRRQTALFEFAFGMTLIAGILSAVAFLSGEGAEDVLKALPDYPKAFVHEHEETGEIALILSGICAGLALLGLPFVQKFATFLRSPKLQSWIRFTFVALVLVLSFVLAGVAHQGGMIRHTEIRVQ